MCSPSASSDQPSSRDGMAGPLVTGDMRSATLVICRHGETSTCSVNGLSERANGSAVRGTTGRASAALAFRRARLDVEVQRGSPQARADDEQVVTHDVVAGLER